MDPNTRQTEAAARIEEDIATLEIGIRQLKVQYDMFFNGALPREPHEMRHQIDRLIRRYREARIQKYQHRFQLTTLISRYAILSELWGRSRRSMEEGDRRTQATTPTQGSNDKLLGRCRLSEAKQEDENLRKLYTRFVEARERNGIAAQVPYAKFVKGIAAQTNQLRKKSGCAEIELRLVVRNDKIQLKARPGK
ncbi:MAG: hypothetical protein GY716_04365 [bacterium]|nr:hypothetical protein [bacterium]